MGSARARGAFLVALLLEAAPVPIPQTHHHSEAKHAQTHRLASEAQERASSQHHDQTGKGDAEKRSAPIVREYRASDRTNQEAEDKGKQGARAEQTPAGDADEAEPPSKAEQTPAGDADEAEPPSKAASKPSRPAAHVNPAPSTNPAPTPAPEPSDEGEGPSPAPVPAQVLVAQPAPVSAVARPAPARPAGGGGIVAVPIEAAVAPAPPLVAPAPAPAVRPRNNPAMAGFPEVVVPPGPEGRRIEVALFALPLLAAIWLWAAVRAGLAAWALRGAAIRSAIANQLGLRTDQLAALDPEGLRRLRDGIAFDEVTGVLRRAAGLASLERELARTARSGQPLSIAFIDVDDLKQTNDTLGHAAGDALLRGVAGVLTRRLRAQDLVFRYGGDEFVCVMPDTPRPRAEAIGAEMRQMAATLGLRFSFGVAQAAPGESTRTVIDRADSLQYLDKQSRKTGR